MKEENPEAFDARVTVIEDPTGTIRLPLSGVPGALSTQAFDSEWKKKVRAVAPELVETRIRSAVLTLVLRAQPLMF